MRNGLGSLRFGQGSGCVAGDAARLPAAVTAVEAPRLPPAQATGVITGHDRQATIVGVSHAVKNPRGIGTVNALSTSSVAFAPVEVAPRRKMASPRECFVVAAGPVAGRPA